MRIDLYYRRIVRKLNENAGKDKWNAGKIDAILLTLKNQKDSRLESAGLLIIELMKMVP